MDIAALALILAFTGADVDQKGMYQDPTTVGEEMRAIIEKEGKPTLIEMKCTQGWMTFERTLKLDYGTVIVYYVPCLKG